MFMEGIQLMDKGFFCRLGGKGGIKNCGGGLFELAFGSFVDFKKLVKFCSVFSKIMQRLHFAELIEGIAAEALKRGFDLIFFEAAVFKDAFGSTGEEVQNFFDNFMGAFLIGFKFWKEAAGVRED